MRLIFLKNVWRKNTHASYKFRIQIYKITQRGSHWTFLECLTVWRKYLCAVFLEHPLHSLVHSSLQLIRKYSYFFSLKNGLVCNRNIWGEMLHWIFNIQKSNSVWFHLSIIHCIYIYIHTWTCISYAVTYNIVTYFLQRRTFELPVSILCFPGV